MKFLAIVTLLSMIALVSALDDREEDAGIVKLGASGCRYSFKIRTGLSFPKVDSVTLRLFNKAGEIVEIKYFGEPDGDFSRNAVTTFYHERDTCLTDIFKGKFIMNAGFNGWSIETIDLFVSSLPTLQRLQHVFGVSTELNRQGSFSSMSVLFDLEDS